MRYSVFIKSIMAFCIAGVGQLTLAREVRLLNFSAIEDSSSIDSWPALPIDQNAAEVAGTLKIEDMMVFELERLAIPSDLPVGSGRPARLPTDLLYIPNWMRARPVSSYFPPSSTAAFADRRASIRYDSCDDAHYIPAWWLDPKTEARRAYHFDTVTAVACEYGLPTSLLDAVIAQESGYKYWAISRKGAMGMMQIMPGTAKQLGLSDPFDALANIKAGARYLRQQLDRFGKVELALAGYNAGPHRRSLREGRLPMIAETLDYVRIIMNNWGRLAPRNAEISMLDRGAAATAAVAESRLRRAVLFRYEALPATTEFR